jgi:quercetin dioxygenase-like cupin family protein
MRSTEPSRSPRRQGFPDHANLPAAWHSGYGSPRALITEIEEGAECDVGANFRNHPTSRCRRAHPDAAAGEDSEGHLAVIEMSLTPNGHAPPLHVHPTHGEGFLVLSGVLSFQLGDQVITGRPGACAFAPRNVPHTLANLGDREGRLLVVCTPAGFERFFDRMIAKRRGEAFGEPRTEAERLTRAVGPPLSALQ